MTQARKPFMKFSSYAGPILDPATSTGLDTTPMKRQSSGFLGMGDTVDLATGRTLKPDPATGKVDYGDRLTISFPSLREYTTLQISRDRGVPIVLLAAILILLGLLPALYTSRRKVWVRVEPAGEGALLKVGGFSLQRKSQFDEEFRRLVEALVKACGGEAPVSRKEKVGTA
jgi:cytochrome c biogenesis protein ResB